MRGNEQSGQRTTGRTPASAAMSLRVTREEFLALLDNQGKNFDDFITHMQQQLSSEIKASRDKTTELEKSLEFSQHKWEEKEAMVERLEKENKLLRMQLTKQIDEMASLNITIKDLSQRTDYLDDYSRRNNLRLCGIPEDRQENWEQTQWKVTKLLRENFNIQPDFERVHRIGKTPDQGKPRDIVARFARFSDRDAVFQERRKLNTLNKKIFINEDFCKNTIEVRKSQSEKLMEARKQGKWAYLSYRKLVIKDRISNSQFQQAQTPDALRASPLTESTILTTSTAAATGGGGVSADAAPGPVVAPSTASLKEFPMIQRDDASGVSADTSSNNTTFSSATTMTGDNNAFNPSKPVAASENRGVRHKKQPEFYQA